MLRRILYFTRISRVRSYEKNATCLHGSMLSVAYDEQRELRTQRVLSLLIQKQSQKARKICDVLAREHSFHIL